MEELSDIVKKENHRMFFTDDGKFSMERIRKYFAHSYAVGCLPAKDQVEYQKRTGFNAVVLTKYNAMSNLLWGIAAYAGIVNLAIPFLKTISPSTAALQWPATAYATAFVIDGIYRYSHATIKKEPCMSPILLPQLVANYVLKKSGNQKKVFELLGKKKNKETEISAEEKPIDILLAKKPTPHRLLSPGALEAIKENAYEQAGKPINYRSGE